MLFRSFMRLKYRFGIIITCLSIINGLMGNLTTAQGQSLEELKTKTVRLPNGWGITPIGNSLKLGDLPLNMAVSPNRQWIAVTNNGQSTQSIQLVDVKSEQIMDTKEVKVAWLGLAWANNSKTLYSSGGNGNYILKWEVISNKLLVQDTIKIGKPWPEKISIAGLALDDKNNLLYAVTKENNALYIIDVIKKNIIKQIPLGGEGFTCVLSKDKKKLYISCWGAQKVIIFDTKKMEISNSIMVGNNPNELILNKKENILYVANSDDNSVSVIDLKKQIVIETLNTALFPDAPTGSTTNGLALSEDGNTLFVANADNNCLALFDVTIAGNSKGKGFIPTGWYPTCVRVIKNKIYVANGKGLSSLPNPKGPNPAQKKQKTNYQQGDVGSKEPVQYIGGLFKGTLSIMDMPNENQLANQSLIVYCNTPYSKTKETESKSEAGNPIPSKLGDKSPIKYVFYIIKENRTYDQVLSDIPGGNGDTSLLLFGQKVTPNQHALAKEFVLLDNFYTDGEVSADGHNWSMGAYATDYLEKTWPSSYGGRGGGYDAEGNRAIANNKKGFIWDYCKRNNITYRTYGEFADDNKANIPALENHFCTHYTGWNQQVKDTTRFNQWRHDFDSLLAKNQVPQLNTLRFINDHTMGLKLGKITPSAQVADNDLAVGLFVDYLSHSKIWKESVVFIVEDDSQNGPDHVDAHRTTAYVAGGQVKHHYIDHSMYSTSSMLHTIEMILGLPPMSQYDAGAESMWKCFTDSVNTKPFKVQKESIDLNEKNTAMNYFQRKSEEFDFNKEDRVSEFDFNNVLWFAIKGDKKPCPSPIRAAFIKENKSEDKD